MKIAILETGHFQYTLTQSAIFSDCEQVIITTENMYKDMLEYHPGMEKFQYDFITSIEKDEQKIVSILENNQIDILMISPVFDSYAALRRIVKKARCIKILTTHNVNTWFNGRFWSPNSFMDRVNMRSIIKNCEYIAVEDFIYNHLKSTNHKYFQKHKFLYIPFTIFHEAKQRKYSKKDSRLKIVLTGAIDGDRRRYEDVIQLIEKFKNDSDKLCFSFAGRRKGDYGTMIQNKLKEIKEVFPELIYFFDDNSTAEMFREEMETSDLVLSTSTKTFKGMGTVEYIGKTKPTAAIHDMMTYQLPGLLPSHLAVPTNLQGSVFNYKNVDHLIELVKSLLIDKKTLDLWQEKAKSNSMNFTAKEIRKGLPF
jgi:hypothetical protein